MKLNFNSVKNDFFAQLEQNGDIAKRQNISKLSIFDYVDKFQEYIEKNYSEDDLKDNISLFKNIKGLKFNSNASSASLKSDNEDNDAKNSDDNEFIVDFMNDLLDNAEFKELLDENKNGKIDEEELNAYFESISNLDNESDDISISDLTDGLSKLKDNDLELNIQRNESEDTTATSDSSETSPISSSSSGSINAGSSTGGGASVGNYSANSGSYTGSGATQSANINDGSYESMSLETLEGKLEGYEAKQQEANEALNKLGNGENSAVKPKKEELDTAEKEYLELLGNSKEYKKEGEEKSYQEQIKENCEQIDNENKNIENYTKEQSQASNNVNSLTGEISSLTSEVKGLESAYQTNASTLESLKSISPTIEKDGEIVANPKYDAAKISDLEAKQKDIKGKIEAKKAEIEKKEKDKREQEEIVNKMKKFVEEATSKREGLEKKNATLEEELNQWLEENDKENYEKLASAQERYNNAQKDYQETYESEYNTINTNCESYDKEIKELQEVIEVKKARAVEKENTISALGNIDALYKQLNLDELGMNYDVFTMAMEGYENLEDKGNGYLGIFDTTQGSDKERYYLIDMNTMEVVGRTALKTGSGNMDNIVTANREGSHATLSGFEQIGEEYYSAEMGKNALRIYGLEEGINDNAFNKGTVVHYTTGEHTYGCKGFTPVYNSNGTVNLNATYEKMRSLFPKGTIMFTYPTDNNYAAMSELVA